MARNMQWAIAQYTWYECWGRYPEIRDGDTAPGMTTTTNQEKAQQNLEAFYGFMLLFIIFCAFNQFKA